mgnify:CR=1 FL=1
MLSCPGKRKEHRSSAAIESRNFIGLQCIECDGMSTGAARKKLRNSICCKTSMDERDVTKRELRSRIRRSLRNLDQQKREKASEKVTRELLESPVWAAADTIFAFVSLPDEVETTALCAEAIREGKRLGLPRFGEEGLVFYHVTDLESLKVDNSMAIRQPAEDFPALCSTRAPRQPGRLLVVTPGRAFTREGERLGRGGGFYDAFFTALRENHILFQAIGIAFDEQLFDSIPTDKNDQRVHGVVTPAESAGLA